MRLSTYTICPSCGRDRLRFAKSNDIVFLISENTMWSGTIEEILRKNNIPYLKERPSGFTLYLGAYSGDFEFFVPFHAFEKASELLDNFF